LVGLKSGKMPAPRAGFDVGCTAVDVAVGRGLGDWLVDA